MSQTAAVPAVAFSHVGFFVKDIVAMEDFFRRVMGFIVTDRGNLGPVKLVLAHALRVLPFAALAAFLLVGLALTGRWPLPSRG